MARPTLFNEAVADEICIRLACGDSLAKICRDEEMPAYRTVMTWLREKAEFRHSYAIAREDQADADADAVTDLGDRVISDKLDPQAARVAIDAKKWSASIRKPSKYGPAHTLRHTGPTGGPVEFSSLTREERLARIQELQERRDRGADGAGRA